MKIEVNNIQKNYGSKPVLKGVSFTVGEGKCVGILGANGSGKSTLLSILAGVSRADGGEFLFDSKSLFHYKKQRAALIGYVPQGTPLIEELSAKDNLSLWYKREDMKRELEGGVLKMLGIGEFLNTTVSKMSGGMKKRLSICCAISERPPVLIMDEPMAALDLACKQKISEYVKKHKADGGIVIMATHDLMEMELCDEWLVLKNGGLKPFTFTGSVDEIVREL
jgi:ABC-2 type transport system ATP-binding protein